MSEPLYSRIDEVARELCITNLVYVMALLILYISDSLSHVDGVAELIYSIATRWL